MNKTKANKNETILIKLSSNEFAVRYLEVFQILTWKGIIEFYLDTLGADEDQMQQILQNLARAEIGSSMEA